MRFDLKGYMGGDGWTSVRLQDEVIADIEAFRKRSGDLYGSNPAFLRAATRFFIEAQEGRHNWRADLRDALEAALVVDPKTPRDLVEAIVRELDAEPGKPSGKPRERRLYPRD